MTRQFWRPASEAEAVSLAAVFVEWLRATGRRPDASPDDLRTWWAEAPGDVLRALADFAAPDPADQRLLHHILPQPASA